MDYSYGNYDNVIIITIIVVVVIIIIINTAVVVAAAFSRSGELRAQKLKSHLSKTQSLKVLPLKPWLGQYVAIHATLTASDFLLANFYPSGPLTCIFFSKPLRSYSRVSSG